MQYSKSPTTIDQQIALLEKRGMKWIDLELVRRWLETVGYYRLSAYWLPFEEPPDSGYTRSKRFISGTQFENAVELYIFDRKLRLLVMEAIERIEVSVRARWTNRFSLKFGAFGYLRNENFECGLEHPNMVAKVARDIQRSNETFITHYRDKYSDPVMPPLWMATETMAFGQLSKWVSRTYDGRIKTEVAKDIGLPSREILETTLQVLALTRNICAHHGRLWNRKLTKRLPYIRRFRGDMFINTNDQNQNQPDNRIYNVLVVLMHLMLHQSSESTFPCRLRELIEEFTEDQRRAMGFPEDWKSRPVWKGTGQSAKPPGPEILEA